jgi:hypothetical protein
LTIFDFLELGRRHLEKYLRATIKEQAEPTCGRIFNA